jgi:hypothetical protein
MASIIIPVLLCLFLGPGVGQLYNKEIKKGIFMIVFSALILTWAIAWYYHAIQPFLPSDMTSVDPEAVSDLLKNAMQQISTQRSGMLFFFKAVLTLVWLYAVVDAYLVADKKRKIGTGGPH